MSNKNVDITFSAHDAKTFKSFSFAIYRLWARWMSSPPVFSGVRVTRSLDLCACFVDRCLSFCTFSFGHCVVCSSSIYGFWLPLWYLQTLFPEMASCALNVISTFLLDIKNVLMIWTNNDLQNMHINLKIE
jgi:hypothetical protein